MKTVKKIILAIFLLFIPFFAYTMQEPKLEKEKKVRFLFKKDLTKICFSLPIKIGAKFEVKDKKDNWIYFYIKDRKENQLLKNAEKSKYFDNNVYNWASYRPVIFGINKGINLKDFFILRDKIVQVDDEHKNFDTVDHNIKIKETTINSYIECFPNIFKSHIKNYKNMTVKDFLGWIREIKRGMAFRYKIHLQVKPEFFVSFLKDFFQFITTDKNCKNIYLVKATKGFRPGMNYPKKGKNLSCAPGAIVIYVALVPGDKDGKNKVLSPLVNAIVNRYKNWTKTLALDVKPAFNEKINDLVYIAGGDRDCKRDYIGFLMSKKEPIDTIYTHGFNFINGYEYEHELESNKSKKHKKEKNNEKRLS